MASNLPVTMTLTPLLPLCYFSIFPPLFTSSSAATTTVSPPSTSTAIIKNTKLPYKDDFKSCLYKYLSKSCKLEAANSLNSWLLNQLSSTSSNYTKVMSELTALWYTVNHIVSLINNQQVCPQAKKRFTKLEAENEKLRLSLNKQTNDSDVKEDEIRAKIDHLQAELHYKDEQITALWKIHLLIISFSSVLSAELFHFWTTHPPGASSAPTLPNFPCQQPLCSLYPQEATNSSQTAPPPHLHGPSLPHPNL